MAVDNQTILEKVYLSATNDYQQRIPDPTQSSISATMKALFDPMNQKYFNQFMDILINRIAFTYVRGELWKNKLAAFKGQKVNYGSTIQEIAPAWIKAHSYEDDSETLLKLARPEAQVWYHSQNRRDRYKISVSPDELRTAFIDEYGLNNFIAKIMQVPMNSDEYDEYRIMVQLMAEYEQNWGFFKHQLSAVPTDEATGKEFLTEIQTYAGMLEFPSTLYNAAPITDIPIFARPNELVLFVTPATNASVNVNTLAVLFNMDVADIKLRKIVIDEFPIPNAVALLTTEDFFVCHDTNYQNTSFWNPETLVTNYYLHHWGIYSVSPFVPAILFTTGTGTSVNKVTETLSAITLAIGEGLSPTVAPGGEIQTSITLTGSLAQGGSSYTGTAIKVAPKAATYEVSCSRTIAGEGDNPGTTVPVQLNARTYIDEYGVLHVQKSGLEDGDVITVVATSTYINPSGSTTTLSDDATVTIDI